MPITERIGQSGNVGHYEVGDQELAVGSTLGAPKIVTVIKATGALEKVFDIDAGLTVLGTLMVRHYDVETNAYLPPSPGGRFTIHPEHQTHEYTLSNGISVLEAVFALNSGAVKPIGKNDDGRAKGTRDDHKSGDPPAVYLSIRIENETDQDLRMATLAYAVLRGDTSHDVLVRYDPKVNGLVAWNRSNRNQARVMGCSRRIDGYETTLDYAKAISQTAPDLSGKTDAPYDPLGILQVDNVIPAHDAVEFAFLVCVGRGRGQAVAAFVRAPQAGEALAQTKRHFHDRLNQTLVYTPDVHVNQGVLWAKANMLRVQSLAPTGWCFTNDPTRSSNSVARDTAWYGMGADHLDPHFVRDSLLAYVERQEKSGLIVEYYDIRTGRSEDYGLNINDNTPLLLMALWHHYNATGDDEFLRSVYPAAIKAARYILSQRNDEGLVCCTATGTGDWGIAGWRNVIPNYRLSGATTEINSECFAALETVSQMGRVLGHHEQSRYFTDEAAALRNAINDRLLNPANGLYYLNIDLDGLAHSEITSDLVFPVMFGVADEETAARIVARLSNEDFWTEGGIRTTPRDAPTYSPKAGWGLVGGIWVGVSFWYAFAAARYSPEFMAQALSTTFRNYSADPRRNNTVPGQFSEWLDGETLTNQGMMLSPWFPPRYLWAALEGMAGFGIEAGEVMIEPRMAPQWKWMAVRNLPFRGRSLTWLVTREPDTHIYASFQHSNVNAATTSYGEDISDGMLISGDSLCGIGLRQDQRVLLFVGNTQDRTVTGHLRWLEGPAGAAYRVRRFDSLLGRWEDAAELLSTSNLRRGITIQVERSGFSLFDLRQEI